MKKVVLPLILIAVELYFFTTRNSMDLELFFFIWAFVFGAFFLFRWMDGDTGVFGIGRNDRDTVHNLATKATEIIFETNKVKKTRLPLGPDLVFLALCLVNVALTMVSS